MASIAPSAPGPDPGPHDCDSPRAGVTPLTSLSVRSRGWGAHGTPFPYSQIVRRLRPSLSEMPNIWGFVAWGWDVVRTPELLGWYVHLSTFSSPGGLGGPQGNTLSPCSCAHPHGTPCPRRPHRPGEFRLTPSPWDTGPRPSHWGTPHFTKCPGTHAPHSVASAPRLRDGPWGPRRVFGTGAASSPVDQETGRPRTGSGQPTHGGRGPDVRVRVTERVRSGPSAAHGEEPEAETRLPGRGRGAPARPPP